MQVNCYNVGKSKVSFESEAISIHPTILIADKVMFESAIPVFIELRERLPKMKDELIISSYKDWFQQDKETSDWCRIMENSLPTIKKAKNLKNKTQDNLVMIGKYNGIVNGFRKRLIDSTELILKNHDLLELLPFKEQGIFDPVMSNYDGMENQEHKYIKDIARALLVREHILLLDKVIEEIYPQTNTASSENEFPDFIKIPLWNFPPIKGLSYQQLKYIRETLKPELSLFKEVLNELNNQTSEILYTSENLFVFEAMCEEMFNPFKEPVQKAIDENLYLSKLKNQYSDKSKINLCLGISSLGNIVNFYEKTNILQPYVANETKQLIAKLGDLDASCFFIYYDFDINQQKNNSDKLNFSV
ncbi:MAG: hypothetical protein WCH34_11140 [Bacteroidota bacterium]